MASTGSPPSLPKPLSRAAQMEIQNRISLATSRMSFLQKYRSKHPSSAAAPTSGTTTKAASFSSLAGKSRPVATASAAQDDGDDDEPPLRAVADPNAGLGHAPKTATATAASRQDDKLRARLVGRQQKGSGGDKAARKRQRDDDSSEDDEPGRSGLGRSKKQMPRPAQHGRRDDQPYDSGDDGRDCTPRQQQSAEDAQYGGKVIVDGGLDRNHTHQPLMQGPRPASTEACLDRVHDDAKGVSKPAEADRLDSNAADTVKRKKKKQKKNKGREKP